MLGTLSNDDAYLRALGLTTGIGNMSLDAVVASDILIRHTRVSSLKGNAKIPHFIGKCGIRESAIKGIV